MKKGYWYILIATVLFSSMEIALKFVAGQFHPVQLNFSRFFVGGLVLLPLAIRGLRKREVKLTGKALGIFALLGLLGMAVSMTFYQLSVTRINASVVAVLFSSNPVFVTLFAFLLLGETISRWQIFGLALDMAGIVAIIDPLHLQMDALGVAFVLISTLLFSLYSVFGKRQCARYGSIVVTSFSFLFGSVEMILLALLSHVPPVADALSAAGLSVFSRVPFFEGYTLASLPVVILIFVLITGVGYSCYLLAMETTSAQTASLVFFIKPALAPILAFLLLKEEIPLNMLAGIALVLCGSLLSRVPELRASRERKRAQIAESAEPSSVE